MSEWQPIETAPKDGTVFLSFGISPDGGVLFAYGKGFGVTRWDSGNGGRWQGGPAYPTHWQQLPEPPK